MVSALEVELTPRSRGNYPRLGNQMEVKLMEEKSMPSGYNELIGWHVAQRKKKLIGKRR